MAPNKAKSKKQKSASTTPTDHEPYPYHTFDGTNESEEGWVTVASSQTQRAVDNSPRLNNIGTAHNSSLPPISPADESSGLSSIGSQDLGLDSDAIAALEEGMDVTSSSRVPAPPPPPPPPPPPRISRQQRAQEKATAMVARMNAVAAARVPKPYTNPPLGKYFDVVSSPSSQPINPIKEPLRAATCWDIGIGRRRQFYLDLVKEWRQALFQKRHAWMDAHSDHVYINRMRYAFKGWVELEADPVSSMHLYNKLQY